MTKPSKRQASASPQIVLERQPDESITDWERALTAIEEGGHARVIRQADGSAEVVWQEARG